jgi:5-(hydroxymethyl)furfural/furfural oxidase
VSEPTRRTVIVGAGSAGCVLAARLSADPQRLVVLLEAGTDTPVAGTSGDGTLDSALGGSTSGSHSFFDAATRPGRAWGDLLARRAVGQIPRPYLRGRGVGGSSAINAMVAIESHPDDHRHWVELGADRWGWDDVAPWFGSTALSINPPPADEVGPVSRAVLEAMGESARLAPLTRDARGRRVSAADAYLTPVVRSRPNLEIRADSLVDRIVFEERRAVGVRLADGTEIAADEVIVAAGAIHSPAVLLRSGLAHLGLGKNLKDHAAVPFVIELDEASRWPTADLPVSVIATWSSSDAADDIQLLPLDHLGPDAPGLGMLMVALMRVESSGTVALSSMDPYEDPIVEMNMLSTANDLRRLSAAAQRVQQLLEHPALRRLGTPSAIDLSDEGLRANLGDYVHASGTCRMGAPGDPDAVVDSHGQVIGYGGLRVCDASIMPDIPRANTHLLTVVIAERIAAQMLANSSSIDSRK